MNGAFQTARPRCRRSSVAELSWEIQRYRVLRHKLLETYSQKAIEATLRRIGVVVIGSIQSLRSRSTRVLRPMDSMRRHQHGSLRAAQTKRMLLLHEIRKLVSGPMRRGASPCRSRSA
ncbi:L-rhamnose isomerase [Bradyrhizobium sp. GM22.5]